MPYRPYGCWSTFIGTVRGLHFVRSASQNGTTSTPVTTILENFSDCTTIVSQEITPDSVSLFILTLKVYPESLITFTILQVLFRNRVARLTKRLFRDILSSVAKQASQGSTSGSQDCNSDNHVDMKIPDKRLARGVPVAYRAKSTPSRS